MKAPTSIAEAEARRDLVRAAALILAQIEVIDRTAGADGDVPVPGYWLHETTGVLRPVIEAYLANGPMTVEQTVAMRAYLRQWIMAPGWGGPEVQDLRLRVEHLTDRASIEAWLDAALALGIDPL